MRARTVSEVVRDVAVSRRAQRSYRAMAKQLDELAVVQAASGRPLAAAISRNAARRAIRAARAEWFDPEPDHAA